LSSQKFVGCVQSEAGEVRCRSCHLSLQFSVSVTAVVSSVQPVSLEVGLSSVCSQFITLLTTSGRG